jgi:hypothetical protein
MPKKTTPPANDEVVIPFKIKNYQWQDWKMLRKIKNDPSLLQDEKYLDWYEAFIDRVCDGQADEIPMLDLMRLVMEAMTREMSGPNSKN